MHWCLGGHRELVFTLSALVKPWPAIFAADCKNFIACTMGASTALSPDNGLEKMSTGLFIRKSFSELICIHNIFLLSWGRYYQMPVTDTVTFSLFFVYSSVIMRGMPEKQLVGSTLTLIVHLPKTGRSISAHT